MLRLQELRLEYQNKIAKARNKAEQIILRHELIGILEKEEHGSDIRARIMLDKANLLEDDAGRICQYDAIIEEFATSTDQITQRTVLSTIVAKAKIVGDRSEKIRLYDWAIERYRNAGVDLSAVRFERAKLFDNPRQLCEFLEPHIAITFSNWEIATLLRDMAKMAGSGAAYDEFIRHFEASADPRAHYMVAEALLEKAATVDDNTEKIALCDKALAHAQQSDDANGTLSMRLLSVIIEATDDKAEKKHRYNQLLDVVQRSGPFHRYKPILDSGVSRNRGNISTIPNWAEQLEGKIRAQSALRR